ncbi:hypothetical protein BD626DRAFT_44630 [Schizophyllum amplum]|uniref:Uncharacterized protein n=1 Tax=Schizophyllum amplum TaxID=97359 RepID=A0A550CDZ6_9AGAR|nr:hypothetical protein BD626DRAFT_44630 [Auriculariopsis ampla]
MSSPSASERAEARRRAILSRGSDRLSKLKTTAHGEGAAYLKDDRPLHPSRSQFMAEDSAMPPPSRGTTPFRDTTPLRGDSPSPFGGVSPSPFRGASPSPFTNSSSSQAPAPATAAPDPSVWSEDEQARFMRALMAGSGGPPPSDNASPGLGAGSEAGAGAGRSPSLPPQDNPLAALMGMAGGAGMGGMGGMGGPAPGAGLEGLENNPLLSMMQQMGIDPQGLQGLSGQPGQTQQQQKPTKPPSRLQRALPLVHAVAVWTLLAYFVFFRPASAAEMKVGSGWGSYGDPQTWMGANSWTSWIAFDASKWRRGGAGWWPWAQLARRAPDLGVWETTVGAQPFVYAFLVLEMLLHSVRIVNGVDAVQPPALLALALPHLPPALSSTIVHGMKYVRMAGLVLDDVAFLVLALAALVVVAGWMA